MPRHQNVVAYTYAIRISSNSVSIIHFEAPCVTNFTWQCLIKE